MDEQSKQTVSTSKLSNIQKKYMNSYAAWEYIEREKGLRNGQESQAPLTLLRTLGSIALRLLASLIVLVFVFIVALLSGKMEIVFWVIAISLFTWTMTPFFRYLSDRNCRLKVSTQS